jgi:hypothetical protein
VVPDDDERSAVIVHSATATAIGCGSVGSLVDGESIRYTAGWGETGELGGVTAFAATIDEPARRIEVVVVAAARRLSRSPREHPGGVGPLMCRTARCGCRRP